MISQITSLYQYSKNYINDYLLKYKSQLLNNKLLILGIPYIWFILFFLLPIFIILKISMAESITASPPYSSLVSYVDRVFTIVLNLENYLDILEDSYYIQALWQSIKTAFIATALCFIIGYPMAYRMSIASSKTQKMLIMLIMLPSWISFLIRIYAWMGILKKTGFINIILLKLAIISEPLELLGSQFAVYLGLVYSYMPFMILPIYANLVSHDRIIYEAASDLGSKPFTTFWNITLPLSKSGISSGCLLVFIPCVGEYVIPELLGSGSNPMIGSVIWQEFFYNRNWPIASAIAILMLIILLIPMTVFSRKTKI